MRLIFLLSKVEERELIDRIDVTPVGGTVQFEGTVQLDFGANQQYHGYCLIGLHTLSFLRQLDVRQAWHTANQNTNISSLDADFACCIIPRVKPSHRSSSDAVYVAGHRLQKKVNHYVDDVCQFLIKVIDTHIDTDEDQSDEITHYFAKYVIPEKFLDKLLHKKCADPMHRMGAYNFNRVGLIDVLPEMENRLKAFRYNINVGIGEQHGKNVVGDAQTLNELVFDQEVTHTKFLEYNKKIFDEILSNGFGYQDPYTPKPLPIPHIPDDIDEIMENKEMHGIWPKIDGHVRTQNKGGFCADLKQILAILYIVGKNINDTEHCYVFILRKKFEVDTVCCD